MTSLEASTLWAQIIHTRSHSEIKTSPINAFHNQRHLVFTPSPITDDSSTFLALHISIATPSEETLHNFFSIVDNLGAYVYCKDLNYNYTYANQQVCELFGKQASIYKKLTSPLLSMNKQLKQKRSITFPLWSNISTTSPPRNHSMIDLGIAAGSLAYQQISQNKKRSRKNYSRAS